MHVMRFKRDFATFIHPSPDSLAISDKAWFRWGMINFVEEIEILHQRALHAVWILFIWRTARFRFGKRGNFVERASCAISKGDFLKVGGVFIDIVSN